MIRYLPTTGSILWSLKCQRNFDSIEDLKRFIADQGNRFYRFIGEHDISFHSHDVEINHLNDHGPVVGWHNYCSVTLNGIITGYCGE